MMNLMKYIAILERQTHCIYTEYISNKYCIYILNVNYKTKTEVAAQNEQFNPHYVVFFIDWC